MRTFFAYVPAARRLMYARGLRSLGQGMLVVNFALYLRALHWTAGSIGLLLTASGLVGAGLGLGVGYLSDRYGRKSFILIYESVTVASALAVTFITSSWIIVLAAMVGSFGRGQNGGAGPFGPAEQAWLTRTVPATLRSRLFSQNAAIGFVGMGLGAAMAGMVGLFHPWLSGAAAFRPLFALVFLGSAVNLFMLSPLKEDYERPTHVTAAAQADARAITQQENRALLRLSATNALNGFAVGLTGPLVSYWFAVRFGVGPAAIGGLMAVSFVATGFSNLATGVMAERLGPVRSVVSIRLVGVAMLVAMALMGNFVWASVFYFTRSLMNRGSVGARQAVSQSLTRDERRGVAASYNMASMRVPASVGPTVAGYLMEDGNLTLPFFLGAGLQLGYALLYGRLFGHMDEGLRRTRVPAGKQVTRPPAV